MHRYCELKILILAVLFCIIFAVSAAAAPTVFLDGRQLSFDVPPAIENGRTLVPLRAIFEALGADVDWNGQTQFGFYSSWSLIEFPIL